MVNLTINDMPITVPEGTTIMEAADMNQIHIPRLCYLKDLNEIGACRVCIVEVEGQEQLMASCNNYVKEGMVIQTNTPRVRQSRKINVELLLSQHDTNCALCKRSGNCSLQAISKDLGIQTYPYPLDLPQDRWPDQFPLVRDSQKCIKCMRCIQVCDKMQTLHVWDVAKTGPRTTIGTRGNIPFQYINCTYCGQCITHCPTAALTERTDTDKVYSALADPDKITVVQVAPAIRTAWADHLGIDPEKANLGRLAATLRRLGFDYVFDTTFTADMTIMEEGMELLDKLQNAEEYDFPMFTSCCPGWVRFLKLEYPDYVHQLSSAKSPQQMFGAIVKTYFADKFEIDPEKIVNVSIMPCTAKKYEGSVYELRDAGEGQDVDIVITTRELANMIKADALNVEELPEEEFDNPLGVGSGAGAIFGATGGVMEAALRTVYSVVTGENPDPDFFENIRGNKGWKEAEADLNGTKVKVAIASGLGNARNLMEALERGEVSYDFVEVMACPGGCVGGGGQPIHDGKELAKERADKLYGLDKIMNLRFSHENPSVIACYKDYFDKPGSDLAHDLLHTNQGAWEL